MFCYQCEQTAGGKGCTISGVCGKQPDTAFIQDEIVAALIDLANAIPEKGPNANAEHLVMDGLFATLTNVNFDNAALRDLLADIRIETGQREYTGKFNPEELFKLDDGDIQSLKSTLLFGLKGMAAYAHHAHLLGKTSTPVFDCMFSCLREYAKPQTVESMLTILMEFGKVNLECMKILDEANTDAYGHPEPVSVTTEIEPGPFVVISGHDLRDLKMLLDQSAGKGVNIYTHGEMLPAHGYPKLREYPHLKGNFGTAWQNQQKEFIDLPAPVLFTTNCIMPIKDNYADRIFSTSIVGHPLAKHIVETNGTKDFSAVIQKAIELGGYKEKSKQTGINGGNTLMTGFARNTVLAHAGEVLDAVKAGALKHIFLVGGCDGARAGRNYYTDFVKATPSDTLILTLACGKYRFNDLDLGKIGPFPRIMDMGQCNDAYSAVVVASALAEAVGCSVNDLPLTLVLSWYEQKACCILLSLLSLGIKRIYLGPSLPAFFSENITKALVEMFDIRATTSPEADLKAILG